MRLRIPTETELQSHPMMKCLERSSLFGTSLFLSSLLLFVVAHLCFTVPLEVNDMIAAAIFWSGLPSFALMMLEKTAITLVSIYHSNKTDLANRARVCVGLLVASLPATYVSITMRMYFTTAPHVTADFVILIILSMVCLPFIFCTGWKLSGLYLRLAGRIMDGVRKQGRKQN